MFYKYIKGKYIIWLIWSLEYTDQIAYQFNFQINLLHANYYKAHVYYITCTPNDFWIWEYHMIKGALLILNVPKSIKKKCKVTITKKWWSIK